MWIWSSPFIILCVYAVQELDVGDSPVLTLCTVHSTVWAGFQIGYILIFDSSSHHLVAQTWLHQYTSIISIVHIPELKRVYVTLATGSVFAFQDELCEMDSHKVCPRPICEYHDLGQPANCVTAVPLELGSGTSHELWVGQSEAMITVLNPSDLSVVAFIHNTTDLSPTPSYMAYLTYTNLVYSNYDTLQVREGERWAGGRERGREVGGREGGRQEGGREGGELFLILCLCRHLPLPWKPVHRRN